MNVDKISMQCLVRPPKEYNHPGTGFSAISVGRETETLKICLHYLNRRSKWPVPHANKWSCKLGPLINVFQEANVNAAALQCFFLLLLLLLIFLTLAIQGKMF